MLLVTASGFINSGETDGTARVSGNVSKASDALNDSDVIGLE